MPTKRSSTYYPDASVRGVELEGVALPPLGYGVLGFSPEFRLPDDEIV